VAIVTTNESGNAKLSQEKVPEISIKTYLSWSLMYAGKELDKASSALNAPRLLRGRKAPTPTKNNLKKLCAKFKAGLK